jgi:hypothetical protein
MKTENFTQAHPGASPWPLVMAGLIALAVAMGIGRFAFTPMMPLMLRDSTLQASVGAEWAAANYAGYLFGALTASWFARDPGKGVRLGLIGVVVTTLAMAWVGDSFAGRLEGALWRAAAGALSAWVLVCASSWCLAGLARRHALPLGGWIYTGVGFGIALTGLMTWFGGQQSARRLWIELGVLACAGAVIVMDYLRAQRVVPAAATHPPPTKDKAGSVSGNAALVLCYGCFGFGYIIPATFLPTMARQQVADPMVFGLIWPVFGLAAVLSVAAVSRWLPALSRRQLWSWAQGGMALGTALPLFSHIIVALAASALLVGGTFMVATMAGLQLAREQVPDNPTPLIARMTAAFAAGQIAGPVLVRLLGGMALSGEAALEWASMVATLLLALSAVWLWRGEN